MNLLNLENKKIKFISRSILDTQKLAQQLSQILKTTEVIALVGDLGSGKTTFLQGLALGLGIKDKVNSPTFNIIRQYKLKKKTFIKTGLEYFYHLDAYRLDSPEELEILGWREMLISNNSIIAIEWAEKIKSILPLSYILIKFKHLSELSREISIVRIKN